MADASLFERGFDAYGQAKIVTLFLPVDDLSPQRYKNAKELHAHVEVPTQPGAPFWFGKNLVETLEDEKCQLQNITLFVSHFDRGALRGETAEIMEKLEDDGRVQFVVIHPENDGYSEVVCDHLSALTEDADADDKSQTLEFHLPGDLLDLVPQKDHERLLKSLANLGNVVSLHVYVNGDHAAESDSLTRVLNAVVKSQSHSDAAGAATLSSLAVSIKETSLPIRDSLRRPSAMLALKELLMTCRSSLHALQLKGLCWNMFNLEPVSEGLVACSTNLECLTFDECAFETECMWLLRPFLQETKGLKRLEMLDFEIKTPNTLLSLLLGLQKNETIQFLDLSEIEDDNHATMDATESQGFTIGETLQTLITNHRCLQSLKMTNNGVFRHVNLEKVAHGTRLGALKRLHVANFRMTDQDVRAFIGALSPVEAKDPSTLLALSLDGSSVGCQGAQAIAQYISHPSCALQDLTLINNNLTDSSFSEILAGMHKNNSISSVYLVLNDDITPDAWTRLAEMLPSLTKLQKLTLICSRRVGEESKKTQEHLYQAFLEGVQGSRSITSCVVRFVYSFPFYDTVVDAKTSFFCKRNKLAAYYNSQPSKSAAMWPFIIRKAYQESPKLLPYALPFHILRSGHSELFSRSNVTSPPHKRQKVEDSKS